MAKDAAIEMPKSFCGQLTELKKVKGIVKGPWVENTSNRQQSRHAENSIKGPVFKQ
jgi:hypothetical protein